eukprot:jgi/Bigna1/126902/aug1.3_g1610
MEKSCVERYLISAVIENLFDPKEIQNLGAAKKKTIIEDVKTEAGRCGPILNVRAFWKNPAGVVLIRFKRPETVDKCISLMNGRWYARRQLKCYRWDGFTAFGADKDREKIALSEAQKRADDKAKKEAENRKATLSDIITKLEAQYKHTGEGGGKGTGAKETQPKQQQQQQPPENFPTANKKKAGRPSSSSHRLDAGKKRGQAVGGEVDDDEDRREQQQQQQQQPVHDSSGTPFSVTPCQTDEESVGSIGSVGTVGSALDVFEGKRKKKATRFVNEMISNGKLNAITQ